VSFEVRPCRDTAECAGAINGIWQYFNGPPSEEVVERWLTVMERERIHAAFDDGEIVGGAGAFTFELSVPGGSLPCSGVTIVGVAPTHRRRGVMRSLMRSHLDDAHARGEPIAALWASEETIYGRFGFGIASWAGEVNVKRASGSFAQPFERRGRVRLVTPEEAKDLMPPVWEALRAQRPGVFSRTDAWWTARPLRIPDEEKANPRKLVVVELDGEVQAYAVYRTTVNFERGLSQSRLDVNEAIGATAQATAELWRFLLDIDLIDTITARLLPPDHPLFLLLAHPRRAGYWRADALWLRLVDVGAALSGRRYAHDGAVVFDVRDGFCSWNEGRWKLVEGRAERTEEPAELALDVDALGSAYLGAVSFAQLRDAFRVEELVDGAAARADELFGWRPLPWCPEIF
jgi:predicted acetyltransferase